MALLPVIRAYQGVWRIFRRYWETYGRFPALVVSPYFHFSLVFTALMFPKWTSNGWSDVVISVMPNIIGFSLGGYAIWLSFGEDRFRALVGQRNRNQAASPYMAVNAAFVHFIVMQVVALLFALLADAYNFELEEETVVARLIACSGMSVATVIDVLRLSSGAIGYWLFIYAILAAVAATFSILRVASWYEHYLANEQKNKEAVKNDKKNEF